MELKGKFCDCKIFTEDVEQEAISQIYDIINCPVSENAHVRIMPDVHAGKGICIGFTAKIGDNINPSHVGCDIGCGVETIFFNKPLSSAYYEEFEKKVRETIPMGFITNNKAQFDVNDFIKLVNNKLDKAYLSGKITKIEINNVEDLAKWLASIEMSTTVFYNSISSIGGGNHYMEYGISEDGKIAAFTIHTGSRNLGIKIEKKWSKIAKNGLFDKKSFNEECKRLRDTVKDKTQMPNLIKNLKREMVKGKFEGYLEGENLKNYLRDMVICQAYAEMNRKTILEKVASIMKGINGAQVIKHFASIHNYIDFDDMILRKGAISAHKGQTMIVPFNMRDGMAICIGKGNEDWNFSCSHGSGRKMSRTKAKEFLNCETFKDEMKDICSTSIGNETIDESPMAYKDTNEIINNIKPTCEIVCFIKPKINWKAKE
jgi:tRNA-splicing ligase RtcB